MNKVPNGHEEGQPGSGCEGSGRADMRRLLKDVLAELLSPTRCASCERPGALLCSECKSAMVHIDPLQACTRCGAPYGRMLCTECAGEDTREGASGYAGEDASEGAGKNANEDARENTNIPFDRCLAAAVFDGPPARIIRAYKDGGERRLADIIAGLMYESALTAERTAPDRYGDILSQADALTFVPVTAAAYRRRGFDHMELVARALSKQAGIPYCDVLAKRGRADQRDLARDQRFAQSHGVYTVVAPEQVTGARLLLIDDVITTGATMKAAASALVKAGAAHVDALALARVWGA